MRTRSECPDDAQAIRSLTTLAFATAPHSSGTEAAIVDALREGSALSVSLVAVDHWEIVGHVAFSPVTISGEDHGWYGLGPVSVKPDRQKQGIGQALIREGLARLGTIGANGCVVLGDPAYYTGFGFKHDPGLRFDGAPAEYFMQLAFHGAAPGGFVRYHAAFDAT